MKKLIAIFVTLTATLGGRCPGASFLDWFRPTTELARVAAPDGHAVATVTSKVQLGPWQVGPEPPKVTALWVRLTLSTGWWNQYNSGYEALGVYQKPEFAYDVAWAPDSAHVAFRAVNALRIVGQDGQCRTVELAPSNSLISSFKWTDNKTLLVVTKRSSEPLDLYGYPNQYHAYQTQAQDVRIYRVDLSGGVTERFSTPVDNPRFMFHSILFIDQEFSPLSSRVAFSDGHALCVYDDAVGKLIAKVPLSGSIEGTWWVTDERLLIGLGLLSSPDLHFAALDLPNGRVEDQTGAVLPLWQRNWNDADWYRMTNTEKLADLQRKTRRLAVGMSRAEVEKVFRERDGGLQGATSTRYYEESEIMIEVPFDQTGGNWNPANRVTGPARLYRGPRHID